MLLFQAQYDSLFWCRFQYCSVFSVVVFQYLGVAVSQCNSVLILKCYSDVVSQCCSVLILKCYSDVVLQCFCVTAF